jgi:DNA-binding NarL/FixJ family response regulator
VAKPGHILLADDEAIFLQTTAALLRREGYRCTCARDAATVIKLLQKETYDLLIADIKMPGNPQLELIQEWPRLAEGVPVILMTAYPSVESAVRAIQLPVVAYLVKPFEFGDLLVEVRKALTQAGAVQAVRGVQQRWQAWGQELTQLMEVVGSRPQAGTKATMEALADLTLRNLAGCLTDLQGLREALGTSQEESPQLSPSLPRTEHPPKVQQKNARVNVGPVQSTLPGGSLELQEAGLSGEAVVKALPPELQAALLQLSRREREVLRLLLANQRTRTIAKKLFISPYTVRNHLRTIFGKLGVHSQIELMERLGPYRLLEPPDRRESPHG